MVAQLPNCFWTFPEVGLKRWDDLPPGREPILKLVLGHLTLTPILIHLEC